MLSSALLSLFAMLTQSSCPLDGIDAVRVSGIGNHQLDGLYISSSSSFSSSSSSSSSARAEPACRFLRRLPSGGTVQLARRGTFWTISVGSRNIYGVKAGARRGEGGGDGEEGPCAPPRTGWSALGGGAPASASASISVPTVTVVTDAPDSTRAALSILLGAKRPQQRHRAVACLLASLGESAAHLLDVGGSVSAAAKTERSDKLIAPPVAQRMMQADALHEVGWYAEASSLLRDALRTTTSATTAAAGSGGDAARAALALSLAHQGLLSAALNESQALVLTGADRHRSAGAGCQLLTADLRLLQGALTDAGKGYQAWRSHQANGPAGSGCHDRDVTRLLVGRQHLTGLRQQLMRGRRLLFAHQALAVIELNNLGAQQGALSIVHALRDGIAHAQPRCTQNALALRAALLIPHVFISGSHVDSELAALRERIKSATVQLQARPAEFPQQGRASHEFWLLLPTTFQLIYIGKSCRRLFESAARLFLAAFPTVQRTAAWLVDEESNSAEEATAKLTSATSATAVTPHAVAGNLRANTSSTITVGFLSGRFRSHSVARVTRGLIERLARSPRFRVVVLLSTRFSGNNARDAVTRAISASAEHSVELPGDLDGARRAIERERLDVLIYAELGEVDPFIYSLAFARLAPIQAKFWGHFATSGLSSIDYYLTSDAFAPDRWGPGGDELFTEQLIRLEGMSAYLLPPGTTGTSRGCASVEAKREAYDSIAGGKENDAHLYVCLQHLSKFHPQFDEVLRQILRRDARAHVVLVFQEGWMLWKSRLVARFRATLGSAALRRIHFLPPLSHQQFLALVGAAVVALDTFPIGGCITTLEALGCGTPVVTWPGAMLTEHFAAGMYRLMRTAAEKSVATASSARLAEQTCIATTVDDYVRKAVQLGKDAALRARVSTHISANEHALYGDTAAVGDWAAFLERAVVGQARRDLQYAHGS